VIAPRALTDTDRRFLEAVLARGLADRRAVESVVRSTSARGTLSRALCEAGLLERATAAGILRELRASRLRPGRRSWTIGAYDLEDELGRGGMGCVYRARHRPTGAQRAVKLMVGAADPELLVRFRREAGALARAGGEGVVPVHEAGVEGGRLFFAMSLMPGGSLRSKSSGGALPWREAASLVGAVARAVGRCHAAGLVHRDLKPENVLLDASGKPHLADFGCVRDLAASALTQSGESLGTPAYMAPEQLDGRRAGPASDVFALGAILHELVSGTRPFSGKNPFELHARILERRRAPLTSIAGVPAGLETVVARALSPLESERPADGYAFARELELALASAVSAAAPGVGVAAKLVGLAALAALVLAAIAAASRSGPAPPAARPSSPRPVREVPRTPPPPPPSSQALSLAAAQRLAENGNAARALSLIERDGLASERVPGESASVVTSLVDRSVTLVQKSVVPVGTDIREAVMVFRLARRIDPRVPVPPPLAQSAEIFAVETRGVELPTEGAQRELLELLELGIRGEKSVADAAAALLASEWEKSYRLGLATPAEAVAGIGRAIAVAPYVGPTFFHRAAVHGALARRLQDRTARLAEFEAMRRDLAAALADNNLSAADDVAAHEYLAEIAFEKGDDAVALRDLEAADPTSLAEQESRSPALAVLHGRLLARLGHPERGAPFVALAARSLEGELAARLAAIARELEGAPDATGCRELDARINALSPTIPR
jgi:serine/threonine protein kinase